MSHGFVHTLRPHVALVTHDGGAHGPVDVARTVAVPDTSNGGDDDTATDTRTDGRVVDVQTPDRDTPGTEDAVVGVAALVAEAPQTLGAAAHVRPHGEPEVGVAVGLQSAPVCTPVMGGVEWAVGSCVSI